MFREDFKGKGAVGKGQDFESRHSDSFQEGRKEGTN